jgi:hypothetical protein
MIPSDGGGGGFTVWDNYDIETIHGMVQAVTDDQIEASWQQVSAWQKTHELLDEHAAKLSMYRQGLVENWPPEKNAASAAFVKYVDDLILSLQQASTASASNVTALSNLTSAVSTARTEVQKAYQEYSTNQTKINTSQNKSTSSSSPTPTPSPSPGPSPVPAGRQQQLTQQARQAMAVLSGAAVDSTWQMSVPPEYTPPTTGVREDNKQQIGVPPVVAMTPPVIPAPRTSASTSGPAMSFPSGTGTDGLPGGSVGASPGGGPVLTGGVIAPASPIVTPTPPTTGPMPGALGGGVLPPGGIIGGPGLGSVGGKMPPGGSGVPKVGPLGGGSGGSIPGVTGEDGVAGGGAGRGLGGGRTLPPGGVIGGSPEAMVGGAATGRVRSGGLGPGGAGGVRRVNPVGGVLGQGSPSAGRSSGAPMGARGTTGGAHASQPFLAAGRGGKGDRDHESRIWDPDDPWAVERGVAPVLEPGREPSSHDPGPGVIGIDR